MKKSRLFLFSIFLLILVLQPISIYADNEELNHVKGQLDDLTVSLQERDNSIKELKASLKESSAPSLENKRTSLLTANPAIVDLNNKSLTEQKVKDKESEKDSTVASLMAQVEDYKKRMASVNESSLHQADQLKERENLLKQQDGELSALKTKLDELNKQLAQHDEVIKQKDNNLALLNEEVGDLKNNLLKKKTDITALQETQKSEKVAQEKLKSLQSDFKDLKSRLREQKKLVREKDARLVSMEKDLSQVKKKLSQSEKPEALKTIQNKTTPPVIPQPQRVEKVVGRSSEIEEIKKKDLCIANLKAELAAARREVINFRMEKQKNQSGGTVPENPARESQNKLLENEVLLNQREKEIGDLKEKIAELKEKLGLSQRIIHEKEDDLKKLSEELTGAKEKGDK